MLLSEGILNHQELSGLESPTVSPLVRAELSFRMRFCFIETANESGISRVILSFLPRSSESRHRISNAVIGSDFERLRLDGQDKNF